HRKLQLARGTVVEIVGRDVGGFPYAGPAQVGVALFRGRLGKLQVVVGAGCQGEKQQNPQGQDQRLRNCPSPLCHVIAPDSSVLTLQTVVPRASLPAWL